MPYFAGEVGLTKATKELWAKRPAPIVYPHASFDPLPRKAKIQTPARPSATTEAKPKRAKVIRLMRGDMDAFQHNRIYSTIRGMK